MTYAIALCLALCCLLITLRIEDALGRALFVLVLLTLLLALFCVLLALLPDPSARVEEHHESNPEGEHESVQLCIKDPVPKPPDRRRDEEAHSPNPDSAL